MKKFFLRAPLMFLLEETFLVSLKSFGNGTAIFLGSTDFILSFSHLYFCSCHFSSFLSLVHSASVSPSLSLLYASHGFRFLLSFLYSNEENVQNRRWWWSVSGADMQQVMNYSQPPISSLYLYREAKERKVREGMKEKEKCVKSDDSIMDSFLAILISCDPSFDHTGSYS